MRNIAQLIISTLAPSVPQVDWPELPQAGEEPELEEESAAFGATVEEPLEGAHTAFGLGRAAAQEVRPGCFSVLEGACLAPAVARPWFFTTARTPRAPFTE